ncbi:MAG: Uma2 family endonuclease [Gammaproteobacteria bacterium]
MSETARSSASKRPDRRATPILDRASPARLSAWRPYYDLRHPLWHKRPDWFAALGVARLYDERDLRLSYVMWQEQVAPYLVVELLSPGTKQEDLGETEREGQAPPTKWTVYEQILRVPYYVVFSRYTDEVRYFQLSGGQYRELRPADQRLWLPQAGLGIGLWPGL